VLYHELQIGDATIQERGQEFLRAAGLGRAVCPDE
jgi:hypothetical protein